MTVLNPWLAATEWTDESEYRETVLGNENWTCTRWPKSGWFRLEGALDEQIDKPPAHTPLLTERPQGGKSAIRRMPTG